MTSDRSDSIFDLAGKKKPAPRKPKEKAPAYGVSPSPAAVGLPKDMSATRSEDVTAMYTRIEEMKEKCDELNRRLQKIYDQSGYNPDTIKEVLKQASGFGDQNWKTLQQEQERFEKQIAKLYGSRGIPEKSKTVEIQEKKRRGKSLGHRKNWLSM